MAKDDVTGLILREHTVEWTTLTPGRDGVHVGSSGVKPLDPAPEDEAEPAEFLAGQVAAALPELRGNVTLALSLDDVLLRVLSVPVTTADELAGMVELQVDKISPFPLDNMVVSHEVLAVREEDQLVLVAAVRQDVVGCRGELLRAAGVSPRRVDVTALGWWRALADASAIPDEGRQVVVVTDNDATEVLVFENGVPAMFRSLGAVSRLDPPQWADELEQELQQTLMTLDLERGEMAAGPVLLCAREEMPEVVREAVRRVAGDCMSHSLDGVARPSEGVARRSSRGARSLLDLAPEGWRTARVRKQFRGSLLRIAAILLGLWVVGVGAFLGVMYYHKACLSDAQAEHTRWREPAEEVYELRQRVLMIRKYLVRTHSPLECLREVSVLLPIGIDLTSYTYRKGESAKLSGEATSVNLVYGFKKKLDDSGLFEEVKLFGPTLNQKRRKQMFDMEITLPGGEA